MDNWRKKDDKFNQPVARTKFNNHYRKPPVGGNSKWQQKVASWEKRFVTCIGSMSWKKFLEAKEFSHLYDNIIMWDDSAGEEAFRNAKDKFFARLHGVPCDIGLPSPDLYVDEIDWNCQVDVEALESSNVDYHYNVAEEPVVIFGDAIPSPYSPYGWGDASDDKAANENDYVNKWDVGGGNCWWDWNDKPQVEDNPPYANLNKKTSRYHGDRHQRKYGYRRKLNTHVHPS